MSVDAGFDHWYAVKNTRILLQPENKLETFGNTLLAYHLLSELDDHPGKIRIREGKLEAGKPLVITPDFSGIETEGLGEEAKAYLEYLRRNERNMRILRYGYRLKSDNFSEVIVTDSMRAVSERVLGEVRRSKDPFTAVVQGVDDPWDIALVELWRRQVELSAQSNIEDLQRNGNLF